MQHHGTIHLSAETEEHVAEDACGGNSGARQMVRLWCPSHYLFFLKPDDQSFVGYLQEIRRRAAALNTRLGDSLLVNFVLGQVKDEALRMRLFDYVDDLDTLVEVADESIWRTAQIDKLMREVDFASEGRSEAVKTETDQSGFTPEQKETSAAAAMRFRGQSRGRGKGRGGQGPRQGRRGKFCFVCGDPDHLARDCPDRKTAPVESEDKE